VAEAGRRRDFITRTGSKLAADLRGREGDPPVLLLHGGGQTRHSWAGAAEALSSAFLTIALDLRGHGDSDWAADGRYDLAVMTEDVQDVIGALDRPPALVGASLGGLVSLDVASRPGRMVSSIVVVDVAPRIEAEGASEITAFMTATAGGFDTVEAAADAVAAYLPHRPRPDDSSGLLKNLRLRDGRYHWHWDPRMVNRKDPPNAALRHKRLSAKARAVKVPTLIVRGGRSRIVSEAGAAELVGFIPHAEFVTIDGAHHMVAGDANDAFNAPVLDFLRRTVPEPAHR